MHPTRRASGFTLLELMVVVAVIGLLAGIAIPSFIRFQARAKQSEAKANLKALYVAERSYFQEKDTFTPSFTQCGFNVERANRYAYQVGFGVWGLELRGAAIPIVVGVPGMVNMISVDNFRYPNAVFLPMITAPATALFDPTNAPVSFPALTTTTCPAGPSCNWVATAVGNIDSDATIDTWFISNVDADNVTGPGRPPSDISAPAGEPQLSTNDVNI